MFMKYATTGMAEIDMKGAIINLNIKGEAVLAPVISANDINNNNFFDILTSVDPELTDKIKLFIDVAGDIATDEPPIFSFSTRDRKE